MTSLRFQPVAPIRLVRADDLRTSLPVFAEILCACVEEGSGVGFVLPFSQEEAEAFWASRIEGLKNGSRYMLAADLEGEAVGTVSLELAPQPNGRHRAEISKLLVHPKARRQGLARALLGEAERLALDLGRSLLVLDTVTGDRAERLYPTCGFQRVGVIPDYAALPDGTLESTTVFFKSL